MPIDRQLHRLLIQPGIHNQSLILGLASHGERAIRRVPIERTLSNRLGAEISRAAEGVDYAIGRLTKQVRTEPVKLTSQHLTDLERKVVQMDGGSSGPVRDKVEAAILRHNSLLRSGLSGGPYNNPETLGSLARMAEQDPHLEVHLRDVEIPSALGDKGRYVKDLLTDAATFYGAGAMADKITQVASEPGKKQKGSLEESMNHLDKAADLLLKAAALIDSLPVQEKAYELAEKLASMGVIEPGDVEKRASIFANDLDGAEVIVADMLRNVEIEKGASTFDTEDLSSSFGPSTGGGSSGGSSRYSGFDAFCAEGV